MSNDVVDFSWDEIDVNNEHAVDDPDEIVDMVHE